MRQRPAGGGPPELATPWPETLATLAALEDPGFPLALAALVHRLGDARSVAVIAERLKLAGSETDRAGWLVAHCAQVDEAHALRWPTLQRLLIAKGGEDLVALAAARAAAGGGNQEDVAFCLEKLDLPTAEINPAPLISGNDLIAHGLVPGPEFQKLLDSVRDEQLERRIATREQALELVDRLRGQSPRG